MSEQERLDNTQETTAEAAAIPKKKIGAYQIISIIVLSLVVALSIAGSIIFVKKIGWSNLFSEGGKDRVRELISNSWARADVVYFAIVFLSVIFALIPNNVVGIAGGVMFKPFYAFILIYIATVLGSLATFGLTRAFGRPLVNQIADEKKLAKVEKLLEGRTGIIIFLFMIIPFMPGDIITYASGLTKIKFRNYLLVMILSRPWSIIFAVWMGGSNIPWWIWAIVIAAILGAFILLGVFGKKIAAYMRKRKAWAPLTDTIEELGSLTSLISWTKKEEAMQSQNIDKKPSLKPKKNFAKNKKKTI